MTNLFPGERDRDASWFEHAELPIKTVPLAPIVLPSTELVGETSAVASANAAPPSALEVQATVLDAPRVEPALPAKEEPPAGEIVDPTAAPVEPSFAGPPAGVPSGPLGILSQGEIAAFAGLVILVVLAILTAVLMRGG
jgi:hypothetical protein